MRKYLLVVSISLLCLACDSQKNKVHTFDEFKDVFNVDLIPIGTYFWDEFRDIEPQYYYTFFPNKFFILSFDFKNYEIIDAEKKF